MNNLENFKEDEYENEFELKDLLYLINRYKFFIIFTSLLFLFLANLYLYSKPYIYSTYSIIEIKSNSKKSNIASDDLLQNAFYSTNKEINKEIEILKTYEINKKAIEKINFQVQFFIEKKYKKHELYAEEIPITINKIKVLNNKILGVNIKIIPNENSYSLEIENSKKDKFLNHILEKKLLTLDNKIYAFGNSIKTDYFELSINKIKDIDQPIYFRINGNSRNIYESVVSSRLNIQQLNKDTSLVQISYEDTIPKRAVDYVNSLVEIFLREGQKSKDKISNKILTFIEKQLKNVKHKLKKSEKALENYKVKNNIINVSAQSSTMINKLSDIEVKISENNLKRTLINKALQLIYNGENFNSIVTILAKLGDDGILIQLNSLHKLKLEDMALKIEYNNEYPKLIKIHNQIAFIKSNILQNTKNLKSSIEDEISSLKKQKKEYEKNLLSLPKKEMTLINLKSQYDVNSKLYIYLLKHKSEKKIINVASTSDYKIIEKAYLPKSPIKPKRSMLVLSFLFLGFIMGVILVAIFSKSSSIIRDITDIKYPKKWLFCVEIPFLKGKKKKNQKINVFEEPQSIFAESYRKLRTDLQFLSKHKKSNIILITSSVEKEGKSTVAVNLSAIFQLAKAKSIIIDLNLRNPTLHKYFNIDNQMGISSYLNEVIDIYDIIFLTRKPNLDVIPAGSNAVNPSELILSKRLEILFSKLREEYEYIFVDTTSIGSFTDTFPLIEYSDINLFILKKGYSKKEYISKLKDLTIKYNLKNVGLIMNGSINRN